MVKKLWNKIQIFMLGFVAPFWGILPVVVGIYGLCVLHRRTLWLAILMFFTSLFLIVSGSIIVYGVGSFINAKITIIQEESK